MCEWQLDCAKENMEANLPASVLVCKETFYENISEHYEIENCKCVKKQTKNSNVAGVFPLLFR